MTNDLKMARPDGCTIRPSNKMVNSSFFEQEHLHAGAEVHPVGHPALIAVGGNVQYLVREIGSATLHHGGHQIGALVVVVVIRRERIQNVRQPPYLAGLQLAQRSRDLGLPEGLGGGWEGPPSLLLPLRGVPLEFWIVRFWGRSRRGRIAAAALGVPRGLDDARDGPIDRLRAVAGLVQHPAHHDPSRFAQIDVLDRRIGVFGGGD
mmetsp:Transcript_9840/g.21310  ORF Transcript_9840/g.21310 Transcript_9840/m.21310 type:complete len:206 (-) Transcript_9840:259-876(-)